MTVIWTSGYGINEAGAFVEWGPKGGDQVHSPAGTSTFDCNSMSYDTEMHTHTDTHISFQQAKEDCSKAILHDKKPHSATFPPLFAAKNHCFSTFFCRNLFGEDEFDNSEFFKNAVEETIIL
ncbi:hypothetical protein SO802_012519 [Lithocarpus litseifolius]|uniref:Uncharacterized protein n=1 Tax=Lithocarpus litseifolius TaxID=425828 RepID=A0AAW2D5I3_9ROSI